MIDVDLAIKNGDVPYFPTSNILYPDYISGSPIQKMRDYQSTRSNGSNGTGYRWSGDSRVRAVSHSSVERVLAAKTVRSVGISVTGDGSRTHEEIPLFLRT